MADQPILMISYWNPTPTLPSKGVFIHDQLHALCRKRSNLIFLGINVLPSRSKIFNVLIEEKELFTNKIITININSILWKFIYTLPFLIYLFLAKLLRKRFPSFKPAIVHSNIVFPCAFVGERLAHNYKARHIISEHWTQVDKILKHPLFGGKALRVYKQSDAIICVSKFLVKQIQEKSGHSNVLLVPNIVDTSIFKYEPGEKKQDELRFSCIATWRIPKRLDLIIDSLIAFANDSEKTIILNVIGEGAQKDQFMNVVLPKNLSIFWLGYLSKIEVARVLNQSDIFLHASELETFSIVTAEALATGTPVMVSNIGALPELIEEQNGLLVENTLDAWIKGLKVISQINFDRKEIARKIADKYSPDSIAGKLEVIYKNFENQ